MASQRYLFPKTVLNKEIAIQVECSSSNRFGAGSVSAFEVCAACVTLDWNSSVNYLLALLINLLFTNTPIYPAFVTLKGNNNQVKTKNSHVSYIVYMCT